MLLALVAIAESLTLSVVPDTLDVAVVNDSRRTASNSSAPLQRVGEETLRNTGAISLDEAIKSLAGVSIKDYGGIGGLKTVDIRNFGASHTAVCYDGIVLSNAQNGQIDIGRIALDEVQSIGVEISGSDDIFRNARLQSSVGTVFIDKRFSRENRASAQMRVGSFGTYSPSVFVNHKIGKNCVGNIALCYLSSDGEYPFTVKNGKEYFQQTRLNSDVTAINAEANFFADIQNAGELKAKVIYYASERGLPGSVVLYTQDPTERLWERQFLADLSYNQRFSDRLALKASAGLQSSWNRYTDADPAYAVPVEDIYLQHEASLSGTVLWSLAPGFELSAAEDFVVNTLDSNLSTCLFPTKESSYTSIAARYHTSRLNACAGALGTLVFEQTRIGEPAPGRQRLSPFASVSFRPVRETDFRIRASLKESYRMPTFNDNYYPRIGNKNLNPEIAFQSNLGITWASAQREDMHFELTADAYYNRIKDKIVAVPSMFLWSMRNLGKVEMAGADLSMEGNIKAWSWLKLSGTLKYSYQYAVDITDPEAKNYRHQIPYCPRNCGSLIFTASTEWLNLGYTLNAVGERFALAQNTSAYRIPPYHDHGISINGSWGFKKNGRLKLHASIEALNLTDINYEIIQYYPMPGRHYRITIKISY